MQFMYFIVRSNYYYNGLIIVLNYRDNASPTPSDSSENSEASGKQLPPPEFKVGEKVTTCSNT